MRSRLPKGSHPRALSTFWMWLKLRDLEIRNRPLSFSVLDWLIVSWLTPKLRQMSGQKWYESSFSIEERTCGPCHYHDLCLQPLPSLPLSPSPGSWLPCPAALHWISPTLKTLPPHLSSLTMSTTQSDPTHSHSHHLHHNLQVSPSCQTATLHHQKQSYLQLHQHRFTQPQHKDKYPPTQEILSHPLHLQVTAPACAVDPMPASTVPQWWMETLTMCPVSSFIIRCTEEGCSP